MSGLSARWGRVWPALVGVTVVGAVGAPAAVASYRHARDVVASVGDEVMAPWLPLSVDGMLAAALVVIWVRRHRGEPAGRGPWAAFAFGMVVTIAANLAAVAEPSGRAYAVALFPPLALAITLELVALLAGRPALPLAGQAGDVAGEGWESDRENPPDWWATAPTAAPSTVAEYAAARALNGSVPPASPTRAPASPTVGDERETAVGEAGEPPVTVSHLAGDTGTADDAAPTAGDGEPAGHPASPTSDTHPTPEVGDEAGESDEERAARLLAAGYGRRRIARELEITEHEARQLAAVARNGHPVTRAPAQRGEVGG